MQTGPFLCASGPDLAEANLFRVAFGLDVIEVRLVVFVLALFGLTGLKSSPFGRFRAGIFQVSPLIRIFWRLVGFTRFDFGIQVAVNPGLAKNM